MSTPHTDRASGATSAAAAAGPGHPVAAPSPTSTFHRHDADCLVPLDKLFQRKDPNKRWEIAFVYEVSADGMYSRWDNLVAVQGCSKLRIPVFLKSAPEWVPAR